MSASEFSGFVAELLGPLGPVSTRRMFGGVGLFYGSSMFGLIAFEELYLKVDARNRPDFEAEGEEPFGYDTKDGRRTILSYWRAPARLLDEPDELRLWARKSVDAALAAAALKGGADKRSFAAPETRSGAGGRRGRR